MRQRPTAVGSLLGTSGLYRVRAGHAGSRSCPPACTRPMGSERLESNLTRPRGFFKHRFHFRLIIGVPLIEWKHAIPQAHPAKVLIFAVVLAYLHKHQGLYLAPRSAFPCVDASPDPRAPAARGTTRSRYDAPLCGCLIKQVLSQPIADGNLPIERCTQLRRPLLGGIIDVEEPEAGAETVCPLEIIHQAPMEIPAHRHALRRRAL
jgi:hypothetical protein